jgi:hypothetical protein
MVAQQASTVGSFVVRSEAAATYHAQAASMDFLATQKSILNSAVAAAGAAYKSAADIPLIGWLIAPAAAAAAFAGVEAFGAQASAERGYDIPRGLSPMTQLHPEEMVLPASIANPVRAMANAANFNEPSGVGGAGGGDTHYHQHDWHIEALDGTSVRRVLQNNRSDHEAAIEDLVRHRNGRGFGG